MSPLKDLFASLQSLLSRLLSTPGLCLRSSQIVPYLLSVKDSGRYGTTYKVLKGLLYAYLVGLLLRTVAFNVHLIKDGEVTAYLTVDPLLSLAAYQFSIFNKYTVAISGLLAFGALYLDLNYFLHNDSRILGDIQVILIENVAQCSTARYGPVGAPPGHSLRHWARSVGELRKFQADDPKTGRQVTFRPKSLKRFPSLSAKHRAYLVLMVLHSETVVWASNLGAGLFFLLIWCLQLGIIFPLLPSLALPLVTLDLTLLLYICFNTFRTIHFSIHETFLYRCLFVGHLKQLYAYLRTATERAAKMTTSQGERERTVTLLGQLAFYQTEHAQVHAGEVYHNQRMVSNLMFVMVTLHLLINVVLLNFLLISRTTPFEMTIVLIITIFQAFFALFGTQMLISMVAPLYTSERTLYRAQGNLRGSSIFKGLFDRQVVSAKLRLMTFLEVVCTKEKFAFTAGPLSKLTKNVVFEFFFGYSGFFLFIAKLLRKHQIKL